MPSGITDILGDIQGIQQMLKKPKPGQRPGMAVPGSLQRGGKVKRGGWAKVHKGERVVPASGSAAELGAGKKKRAKRKVRKPRRRAG